MAIPDYQTLMLPVLKAAANGPTRRSGCRSGDRFPVRPDGGGALGVAAERQATRAPQSRTLGEVLPDQGWPPCCARARDLHAYRPRQGCSRESAPKLDTEYLQQFPAFAAFYQANQASASPTPSGTIEAPSATPEEIVEAAHKAVHAALQAELLERIQQNDPAFFEQLIVDLLVAMGYGGSRRDAAERLGKSGDGGVDGVINEDVLGLDRIYIQAKRYAPSNSVGRPDVQAFTGSLVGLGASKGIFVTTSTFSAQAIQFAAHLPHRDHSH